MKGVDSMAPLQGYVLTSLKSGAEPVLQTPIGDEPDEEENDPILAKWRYGLGATAACLGPHHRLAGDATG